MKPKFLVLLFTFCFLNAFSQTEDIEIQYLRNGYKNGQYSATEFQQLSNDWKALLVSIGGYPKLPYDETTKEIKYKSIKSFDGFDKKTIYSRLMEWGALKFGNLPSVLMYSNSEDGKIMLKGCFSVNYKNDIELFFSSKKENVNSVKCYFTYNFTIKDNKLKIEVSDIIYKYQMSSNVTNNVFVPTYEIEQPINTLYPITYNKSVEWKGRLYLLNETNNTINSYFDDIEKYINNKTTDYNF